MRFSNNFSANIILFLHFRNYSELYSFVSFRPLFHLTTITGDADALYKCLMELYAQKHLTDEEFFPLHVKAHIDRGAVLLDQEQRYGGDFLIHLTELDKSL